MDLTYEYINEGKNFYVTGEYEGYDGVGQVNSIFFGNDMYDMAQIRGTGTAGII